MSSAKKISFKKYFLVFFITLLIFSAGFFLSNFVVEKKITHLTGIQENLRIDILSLETQFSLLAQTPCQNLNESALTQELYNISQKLISIGDTLGPDNPDFLRLKKFYSILEIKHWLLLKKAAKDCQLDLVSIIYFYSDKKICPDCQDQGYILTYLRKNYPILRIYSFDFNLELSVLQTLKSIYSLEKELPIIIVNDNVYYGFKTKDELEEILKDYIELEPPEEATSTEEK
ncbi:MAG: hypothetical protein QMC93_02945 [Patescibacteria group bacterium]|nr:hypothetical protein [Patescibacteria group bacterium]